MARIKAVEDIKELKAKIKVIGLGGAGGNAINRMYEAGVRDVELISANTDAQDLKRNKAAIRIQLGEDLTKGLGVGGDPAKGRLAALESREQLRETLIGADLVFITAGMGGGTGTGSAAVVAEIAKEAGALTIGVVSRPFEFEGRIRAAQAEGGIKDMRAHVDTLLVIPNDSLFGVIDDMTSSADAFRKADDVLRQAIQSISDVITTAGDINMDLNDIKAIMANAGEAHMGIGEGTGPHRAIEAAKQAVVSPLLENVSIEGSKGMIVNIIGAEHLLKLNEIKEAMNFISRKVSPEAKIKFGQVFNETMGDKIRITVIATGFPAKKPKAWPKLGRLSQTPLDPFDDMGADWKGGSAVKPERPADSYDDWSKPAFLHWKVKKLK